MTEERNASRLLAPADALPGVGPKIGAHLARLGLLTVSDLLLHLPFRYEDRTRIAPIASLKPEQDALVAGEVVEVRRTPRGRLECVIDDGTGQILLRFFHVYRTHEQRFTPGRQVICFGRPRRSLAGFELVHPECRARAEAVAESHLTPVYRTVSGLGQSALRRVIATALQHMPEELTVPLAGIPSDGFPSTAAALTFLHRPPPDACIRTEQRHPAERRLALEELVGFELRARERRRWRQRETAVPLRVCGALSQAVRASLPFRLTADQERVLAEIADDLSRDYPMRRLLQGDVGCGKTVVAALAAARAVDSATQVALMAPTELLAEQHWQSFSRWFAPHGESVALLSGPQGTASRRTTLEALANGRVRIVVGTHALFQEAVRFHRLGMIIIDEQHRFGVAQRAALAAKSGEHLPHQLFMTATPIPRTLAQTFYADLALSEIRMRPAGRRPVLTAVLPTARRAEVIERVRSALALGRQAYWVCPAIDESPADIEAATVTAERLRIALRGVRVGLIHGRVAPAEKDQVMRAFSGGDLSVLVATTVIEVGVDVPNASLMVIEHAERMGLAQLHQLRGRVGRGSLESHCLLLYSGPLTPVARERLQCVRETTDGFAVAERDLELRGPGELFGSRQAGVPVWRLADLARDRDLLAEARTLAKRLEDQDPGEAERLRARWSILHDLGIRS
ncbi:MAG: ATP-dependent DNA helicase RecG [Acidiferrobacteraceae bacterium]